MNFHILYQTPTDIDNLWITSDGECLTEVRFICTKPCADVMADLPVFRETRRWLDCYFSGHEPGFLPHYRIANGLTDFRREVLELLLEIPFGQTTTYGALAKELARRRRVARMSAQAVGGAVGWNPLCIIIPCHRVIGADGAMTGYGGGLPNKVALLRHEAMQKSLCFSNDL